MDTSSQLTFLQNYWWILPPLLVWSIVWKGAALWKAARRGDKAWFIVMLILNTAGLVEIFYLYAFSGEKKSR